MADGIGLALIARNEAPALPGLLESITPPAGAPPAFQAAALLDTGSTDDTLTLFEEWAGRMADLAAEHGQPWHHAADRAKWPNDFAQARTLSYQLLDGVAPETVGWFCWADADDAIVGADRLPEIAEAQAPEVAMVIFDYDYAQNQAGACICRLRRERLTRRGQTEWIGRVHEAQAPTVPGGGATVVPPDVAHWRHRAQHIAYPEGKGRDPERNRKILRAWLRDEPDNPRVIGYLGTEALARGEAKDARRWFRRYMKLTTGWDEERAQICRKLAQACLMLGDPDEAEAAAFQAMKTLPAWPDSYLTLAEAAFERQEWAKVEAWASRVVELGVPGTLLIINPLDYTAAPLALLAEAAAAREDWQQAVNLLGQALEVAPDPNVARRHAAFRARAKRENTAQTYAMLLEQLVVHDEQAKALMLADCVPVFAKDHPAVVGARAFIRERVRWLLDGEYAEHYRTGGSKPEDMIPDEKADEVAGSLPRSHFALGMLAGLAAEPEDDG